MLVKQTVEIVADHCYVGWKGLEVSDVHGNEVVIKLSDEQIAALAERLTDKAENSHREKLDKLREQLEKEEDADCS